MVMFQIEQPPEATAPAGDDKPYCKGRKKVTEGGGYSEEREKVLGNCKVRKLGAEADAADDHGKTTQASSYHA